MELLSASAIKILQQIYHDCIEMYRGFYRVKEGTRHYKNRNLLLETEYFFVTLLQVIEKSEIILLDSGANKVKSARSIK